MTLYEVNSRSWLGCLLCRLHDRKIFVLGLCTLLSITGNRPQILNDEAHRLLPSLILVFKGLKRAYECKLTLMLYCTVFHRCRLLAMTWGGDIPPVPSPSPSCPPSLPCLPSRPSRLSSPYPSPPPPLSSLPVSFLSPSLVPTPTC